MVILVLCPLDQIQQAERLLGSVFAEAVAIVALPAPVQPRRPLLATRFEQEYGGAESKGRARQYEDNKKIHGAHP
jgi:hypothetical protein